MGVQVAESWVRSMIRRLIAALCLMAAWCIPDSAQAEGQWIAAPEMNALLFDGPIGPSAAEDFRAILEKHPESRLVAFHSPGGLVVPALKIAEEIF